MRSHAIVLAAALILAPLGARAADLVVWWEKGYYPQEDEAVAEIIAAFEQETGKQVELVLPTGGASGQDRGGARGRPAARLRLRPTICRTTSDNGPSTVGWWISRTQSAPSRTCSIRMRSTGRIAQREDRAEGSVRAADGPHDQPRPRLEEPAGARRFHARRHPARSGRRSGRSGATRCSRRCAGPRAATTSGASACPCRSRRTTLGRVLPVHGCLRGGLRDPRWPARHRRSGGPAQARQGHRQLHGDIPQGLHAARFGRAGPISTTTRRSSLRRSS